MKVLVTGRQGQLVQSLLERGQSWPNHELVAIGTPDLDLALPGSATAVVQSVRPDVVVNAAAYTAVDRAEDEPELAFAVNATGAGEIAAAAREVGAPIIHISTDYVFDGGGNASYREEDEVGPVGAYGRTKLVGEELVRAANPHHLILRTSWVYSPFGGNFVKTMLRLAGSRDELTVVGDQTGNPTSALDLADAIGVLLDRLSASSAADLASTYHVGGTGEASWADFAREIFAVSVEFGGPSAQVRDIATSEWPTTAKRPANSRLDSSKFRETFGFTMPDWRQSVRAVVSRLVRDASAS
jgi:dTDP-4-dehydrorhamnose reductase